MEDVQLPLQLSQMQSARFAGKGFAAFHTAVAEYEAVMTANKMGEAVLLFFFSCSYMSW